MECPICNKKKARFVCAQCARTTLASHQALYSSREEARDRTRTRIQERLVEDGGERSRVANAALLDAREALETIEGAVSETKTDVQELQQTIARLKASNSSRLQQLKQQRAQLEAEKARLKAEHEKQMLELRERYTETAEVLMQTRRVLIKELCNVFGLRRVRREIVGGEKEATSPTEGSSGTATPLERPKDGSGGKEKEYSEDYRIVNVTFPTQGDFWSGLWDAFQPQVGLSAHERNSNPADYSRDEFNTGLGYILHITILASRYLGIPLPFPFEHKGSKSFARAPYPAALETGQMPLHLTSQPNNYDLFLVGFTMVNYDLAYLAHTQGVRIHLSDVPHSLRNLWQALHSPLLGRDPFPPRTMIPNPTGTAAYYATLGNSFPLDFSKGIRALAMLRAGTGVPGAPNGGTGYSFGVGLGNSFLERLADDALLSRLKNNLVGGQGAWGGASAMIASVGGGWSTLGRPENGNGGGAAKNGSSKASSSSSASKAEPVVVPKAKDDRTEKKDDIETTAEGLLDADDADWLVI